MGQILFESAGQVPQAISGSGAVCLARKADCAGDPSLRLKNGYAQDDPITEEDKLLHYSISGHAGGKESSLGGSE